MKFIKVILQIVGLLMLIVAGTLYVCAKDYLSGLDPVSQIMVAFVAPCFGGLGIVLFIEARHRITKN